MVKQIYLKEILIGYCLTFFGIFFSLNFSTIGEFGWIPRGGETLKIILQYGFCIFLTLDFWYLIAGIIYITVPVIFLAFFLFEYLNSQVELESRKSLFFELSFLTLAGLVPVPTLHLSRIFLTFFPILDPNFDLQLAYLTEVLKVQPQDWRPRAFPVKQETLITGYYSIMVVVLYLLILLILDLLSQKHIITKPLKNHIRKILSRVQRAIPRHRLG